MDLSDVKLGIDITSTNGEIGGMIGTKEICNAISIPSVEYLLIDGKVSGMEANITVFDILAARDKSLQG